MRTSKRNPFVSALVIVAMIVLCVQAANFVLTPYGMKSQVVWSEFRQQENLDAVCLGSSLAARSYDPAIIDPLCGGTSFNMGTPSQHTAESYLGLREAIEHHDLKRVYYGVDFSNFIGEEDLYPARVYENEKWKGDSIVEVFDDLAYMLPDTDWLFDHRSLNWLFPWTESQPTGGVRGLIRNAKMRVDGTTLAEAAEINEKGWHYYGQGYGNYTKVFDYNGDEQKNSNQVEGFDSKPITDERLEGLIDMAELCEKNDIEFIVYVPALPEYSLISMKKSYVSMSDRVRTEVEARGGTYFDFNVADPSFYAPHEEHWADYQHYNYEGGKAFSEAFAKLINAYDAGEDVSGWFTTYEQRLANIDHISTVTFGERKIDGGVRLTARCFAGTNVKTEYQFQAILPGTDEYVTIRDWSSDAKFDYLPEQGGRFTIRVNARQPGSDVDFERRTQHVVRIKGGPAA